MFEITVQESAASALVGGSYIPDIPQCADYQDLIERANKITFTLIAPFKDNQGFLLKVKKDVQARLEATELVCRKPELAGMLRKSRF